VLFFVQVWGLLCFGGAGFAFAFALGGGFGDVFAGPGEGGFHFVPLGIQGGGAEGEVAEAGGLTEGGEVVDLGEHGVADHFEADFMPGADLELVGEDGEGDCFVGAFVVVVIAADGNGGGG